MDKQEIQELIATGSMLKGLVLHPGWKIAMEIMQQIEQDRINDIVDYMGSDKELIRSRQLAARSAREIRQALEGRILEAITAAEQLQQHTTSEDMELL